MLGFQKNRGLRIDHILVSEALRPQVTACVVDRAPRKNPQPSDHAPVVVTLGPDPRARPYHRTTQKSCRAFTLQPLA
jgi:exodeoxyribonuclease-3